MAAGIALELYKVTEKMTLLFGSRPKPIVTCCTHLIIKYTLNKTLYMESKSKSVEGEMAGWHH